MKEENQNSEDQECIDILKSIGGIGPYTKKKYLENAIGRKKQADEIWLCQDMFKDAQRKFQFLVKLDKIVEIGNQTLYKDQHLYLQTDEDVGKYFFVIDWDREFVEKQDLKLNKKRAVQTYELLEKYLRMFIDDCQLEHPLQCWVTESITSTKVSIHFYANLGFKTTYELLKFFENYETYVMQQIKSSIEEQILMLKTANTTYADRGIYSKRFFRMLGQSKKGKRNKKIGLFHDQKITLLETPINILSQNVIENRKIKFVSSQELNQGFLSAAQKMPIHQKTLSPIIKNNICQKQIQIQQNTLHQSALDKMRWEINEKGLLNSILDCEVQLFQERIGNNQDEYIAQLKSKTKEKYICPYLKQYPDITRQKPNFHGFTLCSVFYYSSSNRYVLRCTNKKYCHQLIKNDQDKLLMFDQQTYLESNKLILSKRNIHSFNTHLEFIKNNCEIYNEQTVRNLPIKPIVGVISNMGTGKTKALQRLIVERNNIRERMLIITYSQKLACKYQQDLPMFESYLQMKTYEYKDSDRLIICLDSIRHIIGPSITYDFVFVDEAVSVLQHFQSKYMQSKDFCGLAFNQKINYAKYVYFLDASLGNNITYNVIEKFSHQKGKDITWIVNEYVTPKRQQCYIKVYIQQKKDLQICEIVSEQIVSLYNEGKNIVVPCSKYVNVVQIEKILCQKIDQQQILVIHRDENNSSDTSVWNKYRIVIYSPSISAGISFEKIHFNVLIALFQNSMGHTPNVDICLQQLFRVRNLSDKQYYINIMTKKINPNSAFMYPIDEQGVDRLLTRENDDFNVLYKNTNIERELLSILPPKNHEDEYGKVTSFYNKEHTSYDILQGCIINSNKSHLYFEQVMKKQLESQYNMEVQIKQVYFKDGEEVDDELKKLAIRVQQIKQNLNTIFEKAEDYYTLDEKYVIFRQDPLKNYDVFIYPLIEIVGRQNISIKTIDQSEEEEEFNLDVLQNEHQIMYQNRVVHNMFCANPQKIDEDFIKRHVISIDDFDRQQRIKAALKNCHYIVNNIRFFERNFLKYIRQSQSLIQGGQIQREPTLQIYTEKPRRQLDLLYYTHVLFNDIMQIDSEILLRGQGIKIDDSDIRDYIAQLKNILLKNNQLQTFRSTVYDKSDNKKTLNTNKEMQYFFKKLCEESGFDFLQVDEVRKQKNKKRERINVYRLGCETYLYYKNHYECQIFCKTPQEQQEQFQIKIQSEQLNMKYLDIFDDYIDDKVDDSKKDIYYPFKQLEEGLLQIYQRGNKEITYESELILSRQVKQNFQEKLKELYQTNKQFLYSISQEQQKKSNEVLGEELMFKKEGQ